jgi:hypothetical protein
MVLHDVRTLYVYFQTHKIEKNDSRVYFCNRNSVADVYF